MAGTHFRGPVYSTGGFVGTVDSTGSPTQVPLMAMPAPTSINTAGNVTYTAAQLLTGTILRDANGGARTDVLPTAALLVAALGGSSSISGGSALVGMSFDFLIVNTSGAANTVQITMGTGGTSGGGAVLATIAQSTSRWFTLRLTNVTPGAEAYTVYA